MVLMVVPRAGLEPARLSTTDFESAASTNSATGALIFMEWSARFELARVSNLDCKQVPSTTRPRPRKR